MYLSVRADSADILPNDELVASGSADEGTTASLYDLVPGLDTERLDQGKGVSPPDDGRRPFRGDDGTAVELGPPVG